jgi:hypothetical protein
MPSDCEFWFRANGFQGFKHRIGSSLEDTKMPLMSYSELKDRVAEIRRLLTAAKATLVVGQGLELALARAEAVADNNGPVRGVPQNEFLENARSCAAIWNLAETLRPCVARGLNMDTQLRNITTGTLDYGAPLVPGTRNSHYFKDFELELYSAAQCINAGIPHVALNPTPSAPDGDLFLESLRGEAKHPSSLKQLSKNLKDFDDEIRNLNMYGVFFSGVEDLYNVFPPQMFRDDASFQAWLSGKRQETDYFARWFYRMAAGRERVLVTVQTWTFWYQAAGGVSLWREGNAVLFDQRVGVPAQQYQDAERIARVFNPNFLRWSQIEDAVNNHLSDSEKAKIRAGLQKRAYKIWESEGRPVDRALDNWVQAKREFDLPPNMMI